MAKGSNRSLLLQVFALALVLAPISSGCTGGGECRSINCGGLTTPTAPTGPPVVSFPSPGLSIESSLTGTAVSAATVVRFGTQGAADGTYSWDFGDGTSPVAGALVTHIFRADEGTLKTFTVVVTQTSNGRQSTANATISVRSLTGTWDQTDGKDVFDIVQKGTALTGFDLVNNAVRHEMDNGSVSDPRSVTWDRRDNETGGVQDRVSLTVNDAVTQLTGTFTHRNGSSETVTLIRRP